MPVQLKQIALPSGTSTTAVTDGQTLTGTEAAELIAGLDAASNTAQFIATDAEGHVVITDGGVPLMVNGLGVAGSPSGGVVTVQGDPLGEPLRISVPSVSDAGNSTEAVLAGGGVFTGTPVFVRDYASIGIHVYANVGSADDGLRIQWSTDGVLWSETLEFTVHPSIGASFSVGPRADYFRLVYTNGGTAQTTFRIQTNLHYSIVRAGTTRINTPVDGELDATVVKSVIAGRTSAGGSGYVDCKVSPSGALVADVTGTVAVSNLSNPLPISAASLPLPAGAATEATLATRLADTTFTDRINTQGQKTAAASTPVVVASDQSTVPVSIVSGGGSGTQYADGTARGTATGTLLMVDDGTNIQSASSDTLGRQNVNSRITDGVTPSIAAAVKGASTAASGLDPSLVVQISPNTLPGVKLTSNGADYARVLQGNQSASTADASLVVNISPNTSQLNLPVSPKGNPSAGLTNVAALATSVTLLASNTLRKGAMIVNESTSALYVKFGSIATASSYSVLMAANAYYEVPFAYTGVITGIWVAANGFARVTEIS